MTATICKASREALEEKVDEGGKALSHDLVALAEALGTYGFKGTVKLVLTVSLDNAAFGTKDDTVIGRTLELHFRRP